MKTPPAQLDKTTFGFWLYLMTDCVLFASLFATFAVLRANTAGGPSGKDIFDLPFVLTETVLLLTSSFTSGMALLAARAKVHKQVFFWLSATFLLGAAFLFMEMREFTHIVSEGHGWRMSAFLSSFFTLVGTHGAHIAVGLIWMFVMMFRFSASKISANDLRRLTLFTMFWHFLDIVWIFIFTIVYMFGALS